MKEHLQKEHIAVKHIVKENNRGTLNWKLPQSEIISEV